MLTREVKVIHVLSVFKNEKITFIDLMETVMTSKDTSIRPFADKFITSSRLECVLTAMLKRARNRVLDSWLIHNTSLVGKHQLSSLCNRLHRPTFSYDQALLLGWTASSAGDLLQRHLPNIFTLLQDPASSDMKISISDKQNDPNNTESDGVTGWLIK